MLFRSTALGLVAFAASAISVSTVSLPVELSLQARSPAGPPRPPPLPSKKCKKKLKRKAWHTLTKKEKKDYINAELCLMAKPATLGLPSAANRFEELQSIHQIPAAITHGVGAFLPYHRLHMHAHERALREECGYKGAQPYWDEPRDAGHFSASDVFDPLTGFGGNGTGSAGGGLSPQPNMGCISSGPFAGFTNNLGPGHLKGVPNCIYRFVNDTVSLMSSRPYVDECKAKPSYLEFWPCLESAPHVGGHGGVGGKMLDPVASPGDPIFYLHHTWLDKLFWEWQALDLPARFFDIGGPNQPAVGPPPPPPPGSLPLFFPELDKFPDFALLVPPPGSPGPQGDPGNVTTLDHVLDMLGVVPNATIRDVMDIGGDLLCYEYV